MIDPADIDKYKNRMISIKYPSGASIVGTVKAVNSQPNYLSMSLSVDPDGDDGEFVDVMINHDRYDAVTISTVTPPLPTKPGSIIRLVETVDAVHNSFDGQPMILRNVGASVPFFEWETLDGQHSIYPKDIIDFESIDLSKE